MSSVDQSVNVTRVKIVAAIGAACMTACVVMLLQHDLQMLSFEAIHRLSPAIIGWAVVSAGFAATMLVRDRLVPMRLRIAGSLSLFPICGMLLVVFGALGYWVLAALPAFFFIAWLATGRPKFPTWKEFNRG